MSYVLIELACPGRDSKLPQRNKNTIKSVRKSYPLLLKSSARYIDMLIRLITYQF